MGAGLRRWSALSTPQGTESNRADDRLIASEGETDIHNEADRRTKSSLIIHLGKSAEEERIVCRTIRSFPRLDKTLGRFGRHLLPYSLLSYLVKL